MTSVAGLEIEGDTFHYSIEHNNKEFKVSFPKTNAVYGNTPFIGDIQIKDGGTEICRVTWYGIKNVLDRKPDLLEKEITLKQMTKWDLHDILTAIKKYETNYKSRKLSIGMYNDIGNVANAVYYLINKF